MLLRLSNCSSDNFMLLWRCWTCFWPCCWVHSAPRVYRRHRATRLPSPSDETCRSDETTCSRDETAEPQWRDVSQWRDYMLPWRDCRAQQAAGSGRPHQQVLHLRQITRFVRVQAPTLPRFAPTTSHDPRLYRVTGVWPRLGHWVITGSVGHWLYRVTGVWWSRLAG